MKEQPNLNYIKELAGDNSSFQEKFIAIIKDEFPTEKNKYLESLENNRLAEAALIVHKLKHKFNILGLEKGYGLAVQHEENLNNANNTLREGFLDVLTTIETYLENI